MRRLSLLRQVLLLCVTISAASARSDRGTPKAAANGAFGTAGPSELADGSLAWVVQTGRESAEEAVAAIMTTFLQHAAKHTGFVADVESTGRIKLADTGHEIEKWSLARWEDAWPQTGVHSDSDAQAEPDNLTPQHHFYPHGAHKVLPGFNLMHTQWPDASWYIMIDDDTFVFQRALASLLSGLNPEDKHYVGYPRRGAHMCRDVSSSRHRAHSEGPFALGGCGMILSRGALIEFTKVVRDCTIISQDCYLDDVRLFFCLRDIGIHLNTSMKYPAMNFAPNKNVDWGLVDPCERPAVFHGVMPMEMHMLHQADLKNHGLATMADIFAEMSTWGIHSERLGARYSAHHLMMNMSDTVDVRDCRLHCEQQPDCRAWNFANEGKFCELVDRLTPPAENWRFTSGLSQPRYSCHLPETNSA